ncbi:MAG: sodium:proton exchanger [Actinomycetes bacterium]
MRTTWILVCAIVVATATAGVAHYNHASPLLTFVVATVALAGLAWIVSFSTEQVGERFGPAVTGVLQSTLGNLPEFFIVIFALSAGEVVVAQTSIIGSIFANALFVLGLAIIAGCKASPDGIMRFKPRLAKDNAILMMLASFLIVILGISTASGDRASHHVKAISIIGAIALLATYLVWLVDYIRSDTPKEPSHGSPKISMGVALGLLAVAGLGAAFVSDWFVTALTPSMDRLGVPKAFAGLVIVAIAGNAVENTAGVVLALKGEADLAISVVKNSVAQITAFLFPALVLVSLLFATPLTFALAPVYIGALLLTGLALWQITEDGEATRFEGVALIALYVILAVVTFYE